jgi:hypothetical protein
MEFLEGLRSADVYQRPLKKGSSKMDKHPQSRGAKHARVVHISFAP